MYCIRFLLLISSPQIYSLYNYDSIIHLEVTCAMLGASGDTVLTVHQMPLCGVKCSASNSCLGWSWTDDNRCIICRIFDNNNWAISQSLFHNDNVLVQYLVRSEITLKGTNLRQDQYLFTKVHFI